MQVFTGRGNPDGTFTSPDVQAGSYQMAIWDEPLDYIIRFLNVNVEPGDTTIALGDVGVARWFGSITGRVFEDTGLNAAGAPIPGAAADNGIRDCDPADAANCEVGIPGVDLDMPDEPVSDTETPPPAERAPACSSARRRRRSVVPSTIPKMISPSSATPQPEEH